MPLIVPWPDTVQSIFPLAFNIMLTETPWHVAFSCAAVNSFKTTSTAINRAQQQFLTLGGVFLTNNNVDNENWATHGPSEPFLNCQVQKIDLFHNKFSPIGEQPERRKLSHELQQPTAGCIAIFHEL